MSRSRGPGVRSWVFVSGLYLLCSALVLTGCTRDPKKLSAKYLNSGEKYQKAGKVDEAIIQFRNAVHADPQSAEAHYALGRVYQALNNADAAYRELNDAATLNPNHYDAQLRLAALQVERKELEKALARVNSVLKAQPSNADAHAVLAQIYGVKGDLAAAANELGQSVSLQPSRLAFYTALATVHLASAKPEEAQAVLRQAVSANPKSADARLAMSRLYAGVGKMIEAETEARAAISLAAKAVEPRIWLSKIAAGTNRPAEAERILQELKSIAPTNPDAYRQLGAFYETTGETEKAIAEFRAVVKVHPRDLVVKRSLVEALIPFRRFDEANRLNEELLKANPNDALGYLARGRILDAVGQHQQAVTAFQKAVSLVPGMPLAHYLLGTAQQSIGFANAARNSLAKALELQPAYADAAAALAAVAANTGDAEGALKYSAIALKANEDSLPAKIAKARALLITGDLRQSESILEELLNRTPASVPALRVLLDIRARQGKLPDFVLQITQLSQQNPKDAGIHLLAALALSGTGDQHAAESEGRTALQLDPKISDGHTVLAGILFARAAVEPAKAELRAAIDSEPNKLANYLVLESQYEKEANWAEAIRVAEKARKVDPESPLVANQLAYLYLEHGGDTTTALAMAQEAKQKVPNSPYISDTLGWAYYKRGQNTQAVEQFKQSAKAIPAEPIYHYHLGLAYAAMGNKQLAASSLREALKAPNFQNAAEARQVLSKLSSTTH